MFEPFTDKIDIREWWEKAIPSPLRPQPYEEPYVFWSIVGGMFQANETEYGGPEGKQFVFKTPSSQLLWNFLHLLAEHLGDAALAAYNLTLAKSSRLKARFSHNWDVVNKKRIDPHFTCEMCGWRVHYSRNHEVGWDMRQDARIFAISDRIASYRLPTQREASSLRDVILFGVQGVGPATVKRAAQSHMTLHCYQQCQLWGKEDDKASKLYFENIEHLRMAVETAQVNGWLTLPKTRKRVSNG